MELVLNELHSKNMTIDLKKMIPETFFSSDLILENDTVLLRPLTMDDL